MNNTSRGLVGAKKKLLLFVCCILNVFPVLSSSSSSDNVRGEHRIEREKGCSLPCPPVSITLGVSMGVTRQSHDSKKESPTFLCFHVQAVCPS